MSVVTRFPPSPTGFMHIGNARTALFNWLYARHHGGKMQLRIEDTDRARHNEDAVQAIVDGLNWLGMDWDGDIVSQHSRMERHAEVAMQLVENGQAYRCYCTTEELEEMRETARQEGRYTVYDRRWRDRDPAHAPDDVAPVIRIKAPLEGETVINDKVQGPIRMDNKNLDDFIILRSDGSPTYMLAVVVDDHDMGVTHIIRGDDHINNAFRQKILFEAMGWDVPEFAHIPLIHGPDGAKFSKRHGAQSVEEYRKMGYLPEALRNYLLRLGWSHGDEEIMTLERAVSTFSLSEVNKGASRFDFDKLDSINSHYIKQADNDRLLDLACDILETQHILDIDDTARSRISQHMDELKSRATTLLQLADEAAFYAYKVPFPYDDKADALLDHAARDVLQALMEKLRVSEGEPEGETVQAIAKEIAQDLREGKMGKVGMPLRAAITGTTTSPSIFHAVAILGRDESCARIQAALDHIASKDVPGGTGTVV